MTKRIATVKCPGCDKEYEVPIDVREPPTVDEITSALNEALKGQPTADQIQRVIQEQLDGLKPPKEDHRHKTADELLDCPECSDWVAKTSQKYKVVPKEEEPKQPTFEFGGLRRKETE